MNVLPSIIMKKLYEATGTPEVFFQSLPKGISSSIKYVQGDGKYSPSDHQSISDVILLCLSVMHVKKDRRYKKLSAYVPEVSGLLHIYDPLLHIISSSINEISAGPECRDFILGVLQMWYEYLNKHALPADKFCYDMKLRLEDPPLICLFYHSYAFSATADSKHRSLFYNYFYPMYKAVRLLEESDLTIPTFYDYLRAIRMFFKCMPDSIKNLPDHPKIMPLQYISEAVKMIPLADSNSKMHDVYEQKLLTVFQGKPVFGKGIIDRTPNTESRIEIDFNPPDGNVFISANENGKPLLPEDVMFEEFSDDQPDHLSDTGIVFPEGGRYIRLNAKDNVVPHKPAVHSRWESHIHWRGFHFPFDSAFLNTFHFSLIYDLISFAWNISSFRKAVLTFLFISIHTGLDSELLINLKRTVDPDIPLQKNDLALVKVGQHYYIKVPALIKLKTAIHRNDFESWSEYTFIPLPGVMSTMIEQLPFADHVFSYFRNSNDENQSVRLNLSHVDKYLHRVVNNTKKGYFHFPLRISRSKISGSFLPFYKKYGFDPVMCCHISSRDYQHSFKTLAEYRNIPHVMLEEEYLKAFEIAHNHIISNLHKCYELGFLHKRRNSVFSWFALKEPPKDSHSPFATLGYGSAYTPTKAFARSHFSNLIAAIVNSKDIIQCLNYFSILAFHGLQITDGLRPRNNSSVDASSININAKSIRISDKHSRKREERVVILQDTVSKVIANLHQGYRQLQLHFAKKGDNRFLTDNPSKTLFFVSYEQGIEEFTLPKMRSLLLSANLDPVFASNVFRHYLMSHLFSKDNFCNSTISSIVGHQRAGQENTGIFSSVIQPLALRDALAAIDSMLLDLGYYAIEFPDLEV